MSKHFSEAELACPCCGNSDVKEELYDFLETVRYHYGGPMRITSGMRCEARNTEVGGSKYSAHLTGEGVDVACADSDDRHRLLAAAFKAEAEGVGVYSRHIHIDIKTSHRQNKVSWRG